MSGHTTIVTGAGTGIGRAIALRLAADGHNLGLLARDTNRLDATAVAAREAGAGTVSVHGCDIQDPDAVERAFDEAHSALGPLTGLVANSGIGGANEPGPNDRFVQLVQTNLNGTYFCMRAAQARMAPGPNPRHIIAIASILGRFGVAGYTGYCASKTGILGLVRAMALELAPEHIRVNAICPGWVDTTMAREGIDGIAAGMGVSHQQAYDAAMSAVPMRRMSEPEDVAGVVSWLMSADARGVTGQGIDINGGAWMG